MWLSFPYKHTKIYHPYCYRALYLVRELNGNMSDVFQVFAFQNAQMSLLGVNRAFLGFPALEMPGDLWNELGDSTVWEEEKLQQGCHVIKPAI